jgi:hypothetical protein
MPITRVPILGTDGRPLFPQRIVQLADPDETYDELPLGMDSYIPDGHVYYTVNYGVAPMDADPNTAEGLMALYRARRINVPMVYEDAYMTQTMQQWRQRHMLVDLMTASERRPRRSTGRSPRRSPMRRSRSPYGPRRRSRSPYGPLRTSGLLKARSPTRRRSTSTRA